MALVCPQPAPFWRNGAKRYEASVRAGRVLLHVRARAPINHAVNAHATERSHDPRRATGGSGDADARDGGAHVGSYWSRGTQVGRGCWREIRRRVCCRGARGSSGFESRALGRTVKRENIACIACSQTRSHKHIARGAVAQKQAILCANPAAQPNFAVIGGI